MEENKDENLEKLWEEFKVLKNKDQGKNIGKLGQIKPYEYVYSNKDFLRIIEIAQKLNDFKGDLTREQKYEIDAILNKIPKGNLN